MMLLPEAVQQPEAQSQEQLFIVQAAYGVVLVRARNKDEVILKLVRHVQAGGSLPDSLNKLVKSSIDLVEGDVNYIWTK